MKTFDWKTWKAQVGIIRRSLRKLVPGKISVRKGQGTASAWIGVTGPGEFGGFEQDQVKALIGLGLLHSMTKTANYAQIAPDSRAYWAEKLSRLAKAQHAKRGSSPVPGEIGPG